MFRESSFGPDAPNFGPPQEMQPVSPERRIEPGEGLIRPHELLLYEDGLEQATSILQQHGVLHHRILRSSAWKSPDGGE